MGQISIGTEMNHVRFLQYESIFLKMSVENNTGGHLVLKPDHIGAGVEKSPGHLLARRSAFFTNDVVIRAGETKDFTVNLTQNFDMRGTGPYTIRPWVLWRGSRHVGKTQYIDILPGFKLKEMTAGNPENSHVYKFILLTINRYRSDRIFLRIDDRTASIMRGVLELGSVIRIKPPELRVNAKSEVEIEHQVSPSSILRHTFTMDGDLVSQDQYTVRDNQQRFNPISARMSPGERALALHGDRSGPTPPPAAGPVSAKSEQKKKGGFFSNLFRRNKN
ncbi:MAG: hypothetical protein AAF492_20420 [Verrucomicrobiota bacterium]